MKNSVKILFVFIIISIFNGFAIKKKNYSRGLDFQKLIQPVPTNSMIIEDSSFVWCGSMVKGKDGLYHLFYSRWPRKYGFDAWVSHSEIAHAVSNSPYGPFRFKDIALSARGKSFWDGSCTHNPTVKYFNGKYYLYYMGNTGDEKFTLFNNTINETFHPTGNNIAEMEMKKNTLNWSHRNNQRIGLAIADNPNGPWERSDYPLLDVTNDSTVGDALLVTNPTVTEMSDGNFLMVYKAVGKKNKMPFGGPVVILSAISKFPNGPFLKQNKPIFTSNNSIFPAEDPYIWFQEGRYYAILKDMHGAFTKHGQSLVLFCSKDGLNWMPSNHRLVSTPQIKWNNGTVQKVERLERPQLFFEDGKPIVLLLAVLTDKYNSFNLQIPLK